jgi:fructokinase
MKKERYILVGLGEILWDMLPEGKKLGGAPANFAYHAQELGAEGLVVSCVGNDELGTEILDLVEQLGLNGDYIAVDGEHPTGTVTVKLDENGKPDYTIHENVAWDYIPFSKRLSGLAPTVDAVCFGSLCQRCEVSGQSVREFLAATKPDCLRIFDINFRQSYFNVEIVKALLEVSNVLKINDEELPVLARMLGITGTEREILAGLTERFSLKLIALTKGDKGSCLFTAGKISDHPGFPVEVADSVGAGDSFTAAMTVGMLQNKGLDDINEHANRVASFVCSQPGATPRLPDAIAVGN